MLRRKKKSITFRSDWQQTQESHRNVCCERRAMNVVQITNFEKKLMIPTKTDHREIFIRKINSSIVQILPPQSTVEW